MGRQAITNQNHNKQGGWWMCYFNSEISTPSFTPLGLYSTGGMPRPLFYSGMNALVIMSKTSTPLKIPQLQSWKQRATTVVKLLNFNTFESMMGEHVVYEFTYFRFPNIQYTHQSCTTSTQSKSAHRTRAVVLAISSLVDSLHVYSTQVLLILLNYLGFICQPIFLSYKSLPPSVWLLNGTAQNSFPRTLVWADGACWACATWFDGVTVKNGHLNEIPML